MIERGLIGVEFIAVNTDAQVLEESLATHKIQIGANVTRTWSRRRSNVGRKLLKKIGRRSPACLKEATWFLLLREWAAELEQAAPLLLQSKSLGALVIGIVTNLSHGKVNNE